MKPNRRLRLSLQSIPAVLFVLLFALQAAASPDVWRHEWPRTDFGKSAVPFSEILSGGPPKDGIPSIDNPRFGSIAEAKELADNEPVVGFSINGDARAYPLRILTWHEIVNDVVGGVPVSVTYCPLCNAAIVFDRRVDGRVLEFGTTGKLRHSDLVMYDRQTESWWQQFIGTAIIGEMMGKELKVLPARLESFARFRERLPAGRVLRPPVPALRAYGRNPYVRYDSSKVPFLYDGPVLGKVPAMRYVVAVGDQAWTLELLRSKGRIESGDLVLSWAAGNSSALDSRSIAKGRDIGNVIVQQRKSGGTLEDVPYDVTFAFVFYAFNKKAQLQTVGGPVVWERKN